MLRFRVEGGKTLEVMKIESRGRPVRGGEVGRSRPSFLVQNQRPSALSRLLHFFGSRDVDASEALERHIQDGHHQILPLAFR